METNERGRRSDVLVPLSVLVGIVSLFGGLMLLMEKSAGLERRLTRLEYGQEVILKRLDNIQ
jgi:hypothetical protein